MGNLRVTSNLSQHSNKHSGRGKLYVPLLQQGSDIDPHRDSSDINEALLSLNAPRKCSEGQDPTNGLPELGTRQ